jgi:DNA-binding NarL/FixJ family response regulator
MIVDDSAPMRSTIREYLVRLQEDREFCEFEDGRSAVAGYGLCRPDWVCMDIRMPVMDGIAATGEILRSHPFARIIMISNFDDEDLRIAAMQAGALGYVPKDDLSALKEIFSSGYGHESCASHI